MKSTRGWGSQENGFQHAELADMCIVLRLSLTAYPAADIAGQMIERGSGVMIVNLQSTPVNKPHLPFTTMKHTCKQTAIVGESVTCKIADFNK